MLCSGIIHGLKNDYNKHKKEHMPMNPLILGKLMRRNQILVLAFRSLILINKLLKERHDLRQGTSGFQIGTGELSPEI
jgi:hypothetical protein